MSATAVAAWVMSLPRPAARRQAEVDAWRAPVEQSHLARTLTTLAIGRTPSEVTLIERELTLLGSRADGRLG